jgi:hypothetical protein
MTKSLVLQSLRSAKTVFPSKEKTADPWLIGYIVKSPLSVGITSGEDDS